MNVPFGAFMPDRAFVPGSTSPLNNINTVDLPVNVGVIKCMARQVESLYDNGWKQTDYHKMTGTGHWSPLSKQIEQIGLHGGPGHQDRAATVTGITPAVWMSFPMRFSTSRGKS